MNKVENLRNMVGKEGWRGMGQVENESYMRNEIEKEGIVRDKEDGER